MTPEETISQCNEECLICQKDFQKNGLEFRPSMCALCPTGQKLHEALKKVDPSEQKWDRIDWSSSQWKDYYHG